MTQHDLPTLHEFISICKRRHRCKLESLPITGPRGEAQGRCLLRTTGAPRGAVMPAIHGDEVLTYDVLESLCHRLDIPPERFVGKREP